MKTTANLLAAVAVCLMLGCSKASVPGEYQGTLPAADAPGILTTLTLNPDNTFILTSVYLGKDENAFTETGSYAVNSQGIIDLGGEGLRYLKQEDDGSLSVLTLDKEEPEGPLRSYYKLEKTKKL